MIHLKSILLGGLLTLVMFFTVTLGLFVASEVQPVQADEAPAITVFEEEVVYYAPLTDAVPQRDIVNQQFSGLVGQ